MKLPGAITSKSNTRVKALREGFRGRASQPGELVSLEGPNLLEEAMKAGLWIESLFVREGSEEAFAQLDRDKLDEERLFVLSEEVFASAVDTRSPQGLAALARIPAERVVRLNQLRGAALLLESIQDPGNLGTLIRSAEAFGAEAVLLAGESVNPWSSKVLRASAGSVFRMPLVRVASLEEISGLDVSFYAAVAQGVSASNLLETELKFPCVLMVGNEGAGLSAKAAEMASQAVWIPCATESLNAGSAGSVLLYEAMRQRGLP